MQNRQRHPGHVVTLLAWAGLFLLLALPVEMADRIAGGTGLGQRHLPGLVAIMFLVAAAQSLRPVAVFRVLAVLGILVAVAVRFLYAGLMHFSGSGFSQEFFIHLEAESLRVAWNEYRPGFLLLGLSMAAIALLSLRALRRTPRLAPAALVALAVPCMAVLFWARAAMPEWQLVRSAQRWLSPVKVEISDEIRDAWQASGLVETRLTSKRHLRARAPERPRNLVLVYLESVGAGLPMHPEHRNLMPFLRRQMESSPFATRIHHSSFITIEGIVNSQCGTLFQFERSSASLLGYEGIAEELPCLGDVLARAGYRQTYLGGADLGFGGKGRFLAAHGYDEVIGQHELATLGLHQRPDTWGVSDADLFRLALDKIGELRASGRPFNLTLLTIGTHLPGFHYEECERYAGARNRFLDAVHCTDQLLAAFVAELERSDQLHDTLVAITADHHVFPNRDMIRAFGEDVVRDRRLPLVLIGDGARELRGVTGAGYDLAPTLIDLLEIQSNVRFALGRSLLDPLPGRDYFLTRYHDIHQDNVVANAGDCMAGPGIPVPPLDGCRKRELMTLLATINAAHSVPPPRISCEGSAALAAAVPPTPGEPIHLWAGPMDLSGQFIRRARPVAPDREGVYLMETDSIGDIVNRQFFAPGDPPPALPRESAWLAILRPDGSGRPLPGWPVSDPTAAAIIIGRGEEVLQELRADDDGAIRLTLDASQCMALLGRGA